MNDTLESEPLVATVVGDAVPFAAPIQEPSDHRVMPAGDLNDATTGPPITSEPPPVPIAVPVVEALPEAAPAMLATVEDRLAAIERLLGDLNKSQQHEERVTARILERMPVDSQTETPRWYHRFNPFRPMAIPSPSGWLLFDILNELRFVSGMLFDRRFTLTLTSWALLIFSLALAFTCSAWLYPFAWLPLIGSWVHGFLTTVVILLCGGLMSKILQRESLRYRIFLEKRSP